MSDPAGDVTGPLRVIDRWWSEWEFWALAALAAAIYFSRIADLPIRGEETRRAMVAWEMLDSGDWIVPRQQGEPFLSRPPAGSWPIAILAWLVGDLSVVVVRLPTVLATWLTTMLVYAYSRQFLSRLGALSSGLAIATFAQVLQLGRVAETEATFTLLLGGALLVWHWGYTRRWSAAWTWSSAYALVAAATLVKSVQAPVYFCGAVGLYLLWRRDWRYLLSAAHGIGLLVFAALFAAWQLPFYQRLGWTAVQSVWASDVGLRLESLTFTIVAAHILTFPWQVLGCLLPWSLLLPAYAWPQFRRAIGNAGPMVAFLAIAWLVALPTCWFVPNARPRYLMPLYPLAAPLIGLVVQRVHEAEAAAIVRSGWNWFIGAGAVVLAGTSVATIIVPAQSGTWLPVLPQTWSYSIAFSAAAIIGLTTLARNWNQWSARTATITMLTLASMVGLGYAGLAVNALVVRDPQVGRQITALREQIRGTNRMVSFGRVATMFSYHWRDPIVRVTERLPKSAGDLPDQAQYFCFDWNTDRPRVQLPFPWRMESMISCDRSSDEQSGRVVVVGRKVETVALLPDELSLRK